ncbi:MAG TPA: amylo-alpha-1,6-glucosidase [Vicinamibacterales bacterium]|nr:amylo-alpha-1,6-glucosidase [Vicinamibacterales bacterium]
MPVSERHEWLEADGLGGYASGTAAGLRTRRYHSMLLAATTPPTGRQVLVAGLEVQLELDGTVLALSSQRYTPDVIHPDGVSRLEEFSNEPWPRWRYRAGELSIEHSLFVPKGLPMTVLRWGATGSSASARLRVRPLLAGRDYHSLQRENGAFRFDSAMHGSVVRWTPYPGVQPVVAASDGRFTPQPDWYRSFLYDEERARGLDAIEDLACPGVFEWDLARGDAVLILAADTDAVGCALANGPEELARDLAQAEQRRRAAFRDRLERSADAYIVRRGSGCTIAAGYPWFTDWGRDTFIALRGLCLATGRHDVARQILLEWSGAVSEGMLPNRFPDGGEIPEFNAVDASLWFIVAAHEWLAADDSVDANDRQRVQAAIEAVLDGYTRGTRFGIRADDDGLLAAGVDGVQLTWMDARVGGRVVTPRIGKPVEVQALWINALWIGAQQSLRWKEPLARALTSFDHRFWDEAGDGLFDVVDVNHVRGTVDASFRPNQILAIGGLPLALIDGARASRVVDAVERRLWTPLGLRSLASGDSAYVGRYAGGVEARDGAYHQGTVWPWLLGPFVDAWVRSRGNTAAAREAARTRFLDPLLAAMDVAGIGHLPEVADGDPPHTPGGCPFQAWSVGEALRLDRLILSRLPVRDTVRQSRHRKVAEVS